MFQSESEGAMTTNCWLYWTFTNGWTESQYAGCRPMNEAVMNTLGYFSIQQKNELEKKKALQAQAVEDANKRVDAQIKAYEYNKSQNLFYIIYQLLPVSSATHATINILDGEYGWATFNAAITFLGASQLRSLMSTGRSLTKTGLSEVWKEGSYNRNVFFKNSLFKNLYKNADDITAARQSLFPVIDFLDNGTGVVFRAVDDLAAAETGFKKTIDDLANARQTGCVAGATGEVKVTGARLDIGVPGGSSATLPEGISTYAKGKGVSVRAFEIVEEAGEIVAKAANTGDELATLFAGARQRAVAKYGKDAENLIYIKFNKDAGAAAEILDHYGTDGLSALKKVSSIDGAAKELVKDKTLYRAVNETTYNFDKLKTQGIIDPSPSQYPTYVSLDYYTDANVIKSKLQLPKKPTWMAEFDGNQIINDVRIPNGKYLNADYKEVLCRSYPNLGEGGASQFITNSEIKIKRLTNLETGEIINFNQ